MYAGHSKEMGLAKMQIGLQKPAGGPVSGKAVTLDVRLYFKRAKSHYKKDGTLKANAPKHVLKTPDVDNCLKFVQDALEPTVIENDKLITLTAGRVGLPSHPMSDSTQVSWVVG